MCLVKKLWVSYHRDLSRCRPRKLPLSTQIGKAIVESGPIVRVYSHVIGNKPSLGAHSTRPTPCPKLYQSATLLAQLATHGQATREISHMSLYFSPQKIAHKFFFKHNFLAQHQQLPCEPPAIHLVHFDNDVNTVALLIIVGKSIYNLLVI